MDKALGGGSGWVLLSWSPRDNKRVNQWASDHCHTLAGGTPILALDMYEHSYHMDYGAKAADYVGILMAAINWPAVRRIYDGGPLMIRRMLGVLTLAVVLPALVCGSAVSAQENFRLLGEKEIAHGSSAMTSPTLLTGPMVHSCVMKLVVNGQEFGKSRTINTVCRIRAASCSIATKSGCRAKT